MGSQDPRLHSTRQRILGGTLSKPVSSPLKNGAWLFKTCLTQPCPPDPSIPLISGCCPQMMYLRGTQKYPKLNLPHTKLIHLNLKHESHVWLLLPLASCQATSYKVHLPSTT